MPFRKLRFFDYLNGAGSVRHTADEAALFKACDKPVNARFGPQPKGFTHFIERRAGSLLRLMSTNEVEQDALHPCKGRAAHSLPAIAQTAISAATQMIQTLSIT
jgi:hypothetical protein